MEHGGEQEPVVSYTFLWLDDNEKQSVRELVDRNFANKMSAYTKKISALSSDVVIQVKVTVGKNKKQTFDWSFLFTYSGIKEPLVYMREWFKYLVDLINHAFDHFKEELSKLQSVI